MNSERIKKAYELAKEQYDAIGVDTERVNERMSEVVISLHCWQTDDVGGFEKPNASLSGGDIQATGNYPGKTRTVEQMRAEQEKVMPLLPGKQRLNLHAIYCEFGGNTIDRDRIGVEHFQGWIDWAKDQEIGLDFNESYISHPLANSGFTLSSKDDAVRQFWVEHMKRCREIGAEIGKQLGTSCIHNIWIPPIQMLPEDSAMPKPW